eukprot:tig00021314_g20116.t1
MLELPKPSGLGNVLALDPDREARAACTASNSCAIASSSDIDTSCPSGFPWSFRSGARFVSAPHTHTKSNRQSQLQQPCSYDHVELQLDSLPVHVSIANIPDPPRISAAGRTFVNIVPPGEGSTTQRNPSNSPSQLRIHKVKVEPDSNPQGEEVTPQVAPVDEPAHGTDPEEVEFPSAIGAIEEADDQRSSDGEIDGDDYRAHDHELEGGGEEFEDEREELEEHARGPHGGELELQGGELEEDVGADADLDADSDFEAAEADGSELEDSSTSSGSSSEAGSLRGRRRKRRRGGRGGRGGSRSRARLGLPFTSARTLGALKRPGDRRVASSYAGLDSAGLRAPCQFCGEEMLLSQHFQHFGACPKAAPAPFMTCLHCGTQGLKGMLGLGRHMRFCSSFISSGRANIVSEQPTANRESRVDESATSTQARNSTSFSSEQTTTSARVQAPCQFCGLSLPLSKHHKHFGMCTQSSDAVHLSCRRCGTEGLLGLTGLGRHMRFCDPERIKDQAYAARCAAARAHKRGKRCSIVQHDAAPDPAPSPTPAPRPAHAPLQLEAPAPEEISNAEDREAAGFAQGPAMGPSGSPGPNEACQLCGEGAADRGELSRHLAACPAAAACAGPVDCARCGAGDLQGVPGLAQHLLACSPSPQPGRPARPSHFRYWKDYERLQRQRILEEGAAKSAFDRVKERHAQRRPSEQSSSSPDPEAAAGHASSRNQRRRVSGSGRGGELESEGGFAGEVGPGAELGGGGGLGDGDVTFNELEDDELAPCQFCGEELYLTRHRAHFAVCRAAQQAVVAAAEASGLPVRFPCARCGLTGWKGLVGLGSHLSRACEPNMDERTRASRQALIDMRISRPAPAPAPAPVPVAAADRDADWDADWDADAAADADADSDGVVGPGGLLDADWRPPPRAAPRPVAIARPGGLELAIPRPVRRRRRGRGPRPTPREGVPQSPRPRSTRRARARRAVSPHTIRATDCSWDSQGPVTCQFCSAQLLLHEYSRHLRTCAVAGPKFQRAPYAPTDCNNCGAKGFKGLQGIARHIFRGGCRKYLADPAAAHAVRGRKRVWLEKQSAGPGKKLKEQHAEADEGEEGQGDSGGVGGAGGAAAAGAAGGAGAPRRPTRAYPMKTEQVKWRYRMKLHERQQQALTGAAAEDSPDVHPAPPRARCRWARVAIGHGPRALTGAAAAPPPQAKAPCEFCGTELAGSQHSAHFNLCPAPRHAPCQFCGAMVERRQHSAHFNLCPTALTAAAAAAAAAAASSSSSAPEPWFVDYPRRRGGGGALALVRPQAPPGPPPPPRAAAAAAAAAAGAAGVPCGRLAAGPRPVDSEHDGRYVNVRLLDGSRDAGLRAGRGEPLEALLARASAALGARVAELWSRGYSRLRSGEEVLASPDFVLFAVREEDL